MPRLFQTLRFLQSPSFWQAQSALIGQLTRALWLAEHHKHESEMSLPFRLITSFSFQNQKQLIMSLVLPSVQAERGT